MIARFNVTGFIEVDLSKEEIKELNQYKAETTKKAYLNDILRHKLNICSMTADHELNVKVDFENLYVEKDWNKYGGSIVDLDKNDPYGSPYGIYLENIPTTYVEEVESTIKDIGNRKKNKKR